MKLMQLGPEAEGEMKNGDILVKVNEDDVSEWPIKHIVQRLNDFRVPVDTEVKLTFARKILKLEYEDELGINNTTSSTTKPFSTKPEVTTTQSSDTAQEETESKGDDDDDHDSVSIDIDESTKQFAEEVEEVCTLCVCLCFAS
jgi:membrane-associated protease RseP (regulator of RpoE activity)